MSQERTSWKESIRAMATLSASWLLLGLPAAAEIPNVAAAPPLQSDLKSQMQNGLRLALPATSNPRGQAHGEEKRERGGPSTKSQSKSQPQP
jgi:hypothetical protein